MKKTILEPCIVGKDNVLYDAVIKLEDKNMMLGRGKDCKSKIISSCERPPKVSRRHAVINCENDKYYICDNMNTLGVFVNGDKIDKEKYVQLKENDILTFGTLPYEGGIAYKFKQYDVGDEENPHINKKLKIDQSTSVNDTDLNTSISFKNWKENNQSTDKIKLFDDIKQQLTCALCHKMFILPTTCNCTHTFCKYCLLNYYKSNDDSKCPICSEVLSTPFHPSHDLEVISNIALKSLNDLEQIKYFERLKQYDVELSKMGYSTENMNKLSEEEEKIDSDSKEEDDTNDNDGYESSASVDSTLFDEND